MSLETTIMSCAAGVLSALVFLANAVGTPSLKSAAFDKAVKAIHIHRRLNSRRLFYYQELRSLSRTWSFTSLCFLATAIVGFATRELFLVRSAIVTSLSILGLAILHLWRVLYRCQEDWEVTAESDFQRYVTAQESARRE